MAAQFGFRAHHVEPGLPIERRTSPSRSQTRSIATNPTVKAQPASRSSSHASHPRPDGRSSSHASHPWPNACATASHLCHPYAYRPSSIPQSHRSLTRLLCHPYASRSPFGQGLGSHRLAPRCVLLRRHPSGRLCFQPPSPESRAPSRQRLGPAVAPGPRALGFVRGPILHWQRR